MRAPPPMNQNDPEMEALKVEQIDRDAAADLMVALFENSHGLEAEAQWSVPVRTGEDDDYPIVTAFARHRIQFAEQRVNAALDEAVRVARRDRRNATARKLGYQPDWHRYAAAIAEEIEALKSPHPEQKK